MRELHVVGTAADGALLLADRPGGPPRYRLPDSRVVPEPRERPVRPPPGPARIQAMLRRGMTPEAIARETGADVDRVLRWAQPVRAEMADVLRQALDTRVVDGDRRSTRPLGAIVDDAVRDTPDTTEWHVTRRADGRWRLLLHVDGPAGLRTANWIWEPRTRHLVAASARARRVSFPDGAG